MLVNGTVCTDQFGLLIGWKLGRDYIWTKGMSWNSVVAHVLIANKQSNRIIQSESFIYSSMAPPSSWAAAGSSADPAASSGAASACLRDGFLVESRRFKYSWTESSLYSVNDSPFPTTQIVTFWAVNSWILCYHISHGYGTNHTWSAGRVSRRAISPCLINSFLSDVSSCVKT